MKRPIVIASVAKQSSPLRWIATSLALLAMTVILLSPPAHAARELPKAEVIALYFYADWCPSCKLLSPKLAEARAAGNFDKKKILFVTLNLTDKATIHQSSMLASALGVAPFVQAQGSGTGYVALLDATSKKELARIENTHTVADIQQALDKALATQ